MCIDNNHTNRNAKKEMPNTDTQHFHEKEYPRIDYAYM